ncbi:Uncharacterised protein [Chryseobacterium carnipullorum]|uniref:Uncharacterized protein n=1 Tax=Chryseobacterium carnipullorum TaxID=1124835 RepID=A0A376DNG2_CHRCU|nr:Uncharacterised protein [Chryseobacterium carnipullorum]
MRKSRKNSLNILIISKIFYIYDENIVLLHGYVKSVNFLFDIFESTNQYYCFN